MDVPNSTDPNLSGDMLITKIDNDEELMLSYEIALKDILVLEQEIEHDNLVSKGQAKALESISKKCLNKYIGVESYTELPSTVNVDAFKSSIANIKLDVLKDMLESFLVSLRYILIYAKRVNAKYIKPPMDNNCNKLEVDISEGPISDAIIDWVKVNNSPFIIKYYNDNNLYIEHIKALLYDLNNIVFHTTSIISAILKSLNTDLPSLLVLKTKFESSTIKTTSEATLGMSIIDYINNVVNDKTQIDDAFFSEIDEWVKKVLNIICNTDISNSIINNDSVNLLCTKSNNYIDFLMEQSTGVLLNRNKDSSSIDVESLIAIYIAAYSKLLKPLGYVLACIYSIDVEVTYFSNGIIDRLKF